MRTLITLVLLLVATLAIFGSKMFFAQKQKESHDSPSLVAKEEKKVQSENIAAHAVDDKNPVVEKSIPPVPKSSDQEWTVLEQVRDRSLRFSQMGRDSIESFLEESSIGEGAVFLGALKNNFVFLRENERNMGYLPGLLKDLKGTWRSTFSNEVPKAKNDRDYSIELRFDGRSLVLEITSPNEFKFQVNDIYSVLKTDTTNAMPNLMIGLDKLEVAGYNHPMYIQLFPMSGETTMLATLYNTDQNERAKVFYHQSEFLVFQKVSD